MIKCLESLKFSVGNRQNKTALIACFGLGAAYGAAHVFLKWRNKQILLAKYKKRREKEQAYIQQLLDELQDEDEDERNKILSMSAEELIAAAQEGRIKPVQIVKSYIYKAGKSTQRTNSITSMIPSAINDAKQLEKIKDPSAYPLYGLPVSIKEANSLKGLDSTIGSGLWLDKPWDSDCAMVAVLKSQGAIPFAKTNLPQTMYSFGCSNPIFGETHNPHNLDFAPGGSSSGEGALVGDGGSILGFGSDLGGSVRVPSHICGIAGLKPTSKRISLVGSNSPQPGMANLHPCNGPMSRNVDTLALAMRGLLCPLMNELDPYTIPIPFNEELYNSTRPLKIGYYTDDGYNKPIPVIQRAVLKAKMALEKAGHTLVPFKVPRIEDANRIFSSLILADGLNAVYDIVKNDQIDGSIKQLFYTRSIPPVIKQIWGFCLNLMWPRIGKDYHLLARGEIGVEELWKLEHEGFLYKADFFAAWESEMGSLDALICPPYPLVACPKEYLNYAFELLSYTAIYVFLDCPAGVVPVTKTTQADCNALKTFQGHYGDPWDERRKKACKDSIGMPAGVQCVAKPMKDELCLRVMKEIEKGVNYEL